MTPTDRLASRRLRAAFDLFSAAVEIQRMNLRRRHPAASPERIEHMLAAWLLERPGAPDGDADGVVVERSG